METDQNTLLATILSKWNNVPDIDKLWLQFCFECGQVTSYALEDTCANCGHVYDPSETDEKCPKCNSKEYISHCEKCGVPIDASYLDDYLFDKDFEWNDEELNSILNYLDTKYK